MCEAVPEVTGELFNGQAVQLGGALFERCGVVGTGGVEVGDAGEDGFGAFDGGVLCNAERG